MIQDPSHRVDGPSSWVERWLVPASPGATLLDFACGSGRHALYGRALGYTVLAVDQNGSALSLIERMGVRTLQKDLEHGRWPFSAERFDAVVCTHYLFRPRLDLMLGLVAPGGRWIHETFAVGNAEYGRPSNPDFLLQPGELLGAAQRSGLQVLAYEDGVVSHPRAARLQRIVALRPPVAASSLALG